MTLEYRLSETQLVVDPNACLQVYRGSGSSTLNTLCETSVQFVYRQTIKLHETFENCFSILSFSIFIKTNNKFISIEID